MFIFTHVYKLTLTSKQNTEGSGPSTDDDRSFNY